MIELKDAKSFLASIEKYNGNEILDVKIGSDLLQPLLSTGDTLYFSPCYDIQDNAPMLLLKEKKMTIGIATHEGSNVKLFDILDNEFFCFTDTDAENLPIIILGEVLGFFNTQKAKNITNRSL